MRKLFLGSLLVISGCSSAQPDAGFEAVLVKKPIFFGSGGVDKTPVKTGLTFIAYTTTPIYVDMRPFTKRVHVNDMMTSDGVPLDFDATIAMQVNDSVKLIEKFGHDWYRINVEPTFLRFVRDAVKKHGMNETAIVATAGDAIDKEVEDKLEVYLKESDLPVILRDVTLGRANPPDAVKNQRIQTAEQQQRIQTEAQRKLAEDGRKDAELSRAAADNAYREAMQLSPEQFLELERLKTFPQVCGGGKCTVFLGNSSSVVPTFNMQK